LFFSRLFFLYYQVLNVEGTDIYMSLECGTLDGMSTSLGPLVLLQPLIFWRPVTKEDARSRVLDSVRVRGSTGSLSLPALFLKSQATSPVNAFLAVQVEGEHVEIITSGEFPDVFFDAIPPFQPIPGITEFFKGECKVLLYLNNLTVFPQTAASTLWILLMTLTQVRTCATYCWCRRVLIDVASSE
jgi:hypothetical protein